MRTEVYHDFTSHLCPVIGCVDTVSVLLDVFRALKTRGNTPKYGLIFHSTFIGRAASSNKGRISRYLANKASIASRIDCFSGESRVCIFLSVRHARVAPFVPPPPSHLKSCLCTALL